MVEGLQRLAMITEQSDPSTRAEIAYLHLDHLATPILATDTAGAVVWRANATAFGQHDEIVLAGF